MSWVLVSWWRGCSLFVEFAYWYSDLDYLMYDTYDIVGLGGCGIRCYRIGSVCLSV